MLTRAPASKDTKGLWDLQLEDEDYTMLEINLHFSIGLKANKTNAQKFNSIYHKMKAMQNQGIMSTSEDYEYGQIREYDFPVVF